MSPVRRPPRFRPGLDGRAVFHPPPEPVAEAVASQRRVVVVGGGIAGLAAAAGLASAGVDVTVLEREEELGGRVRSWPVTLADGSSAQMSRGFHAFFRQYYTLRSLLRRADPDLRALIPLADYPLVRAGGGSDSFAGIPRTPPFNLAAFVARSPSFTLCGLAGVDVDAALGLLDVSFPELYGELDGVSAAEVLDRLRFPEEARHLALEVFARSFFADPCEFSGAELVAMFHMYFVGSSEGLLFDVPRDDYDSTLWAPLRAHLESLGVRFLLGMPCARVEHTPAGVRVVTTPSARRSSAEGAIEELDADAVVLALDPRALRAVVAASPHFTSSEPGRAWADQVAAVQSAPRFAVWRLWLSGRVAAGRAPFIGTSGYGPLDNVSVLELFEDHARRWSETHGGSVVELHAYAIGDDVSEADLRAQMRTELSTLYPETADLDVVGEQWLWGDDCVAVGLEPWASRPDVATPDPRVVLAGDCVRVDLPVALMERAAATGTIAADTLLAGWGRRGQGVWTVPMRGRLERLPALARRGIRTARGLRGL
jgi:isorenieratene synthase